MDIGRDVFDQYAVVRTGKLYSVQPASTRGKALSTNLEALYLIRKGLFAPFE